MSIVEQSAQDLGLLQARVSIPQHVVHRGFVKETVVLNLETGRYHGLNPTGGRMLETLQKQGLVNAAAARIAEEFSRPLEEVQRDICEFVSELAARGLVEVESPGSA